MRKNYFLKTILLATALLFVNASAWADTYSTSVTAKVWSAFGKQTLNSVEWDAQGTNASYFGYDATKGQQFGSSNQPNTSLTLKTSQIAGTITSIKISTSGASSIAGNVSISVGGTVFSPASTALTATNTAYTFTGSASGEIVISWAQTSSKALYLKGIEVVYSAGTTPSPTINVDKSALTFSNTDVNEVSQPQIVAVTASNLTTPLSYTVTGANDVDFEVSGTLTNAGGSLNVSFAPASAGAKTAVLTITDGTINKAVNLSGTAVAPVLIAPIANVDPIKNQDGFIAIWNPVVGATEYILNVYTKSSIITRAAQVVFSENFDGFTSGATGSGAHATDISASLDSYTQETGWTGSKIYQAGGTVKMGASGTLGYITTPEIDLSANGGAFTLSFDAMAWSGDATSLKIYLNDVEVYTVSELNNDANYTLKSYDIPLTGGTSTSKIRFEGLQASKGRFFLENLEIAQDGGASTTINHITGSPFTGLSNTSYAVSGLTPNTTYYYTVVAKNATSVSSPSNEVTVDFFLTNLNEEEQTSNIDVWISEGEIHFNAKAGEAIELFSITGQKLDSRTATEGLNDLSISAKGVIILKVGNKIAKVIL